MYHSITIGNKNTWDDWHLVPLSRPLFSAPIPKTNFVDIPGGDGEIDLTSAISGRIAYESRTGTFEFMVANGYTEWYMLYSEIMNYLQGRKLTAVLEDDPGYYYEGRFWLKEWKTDERYSTVTIEYNVSPYKKPTNLGEDWLWDPFNFETDVVQNYRNVTIDGSTTIILRSGIVGMPLEISSSTDSVILSIGGHSYTLSKGINRIPTNEMSEGLNTLVFSGNGVITVLNAGRSL